MTLRPAVFVPSASGWAQIVEALETAWRNWWVRAAERADKSVGLDLERIEAWWRG